MAAQFLAAQGIDIDAEMSRIQYSQQAGLGTGTGPSYTDPLRLTPFRRIDTILCAALPNTDRGSLWDVSVVAGQIQSTSEHDPARLRAFLSNPCDSTIHAH